MVLAAVKLPKFVLLYHQVHTHAAIPALGVSICVDDRGIASLQILRLGRNHSYHVALRLETAIECL